MLPVFSGPTLILGFAAALTSCLFLGIFFPLYDFVKARRHAVKHRRPLPGKDFLVHEFRTNPFLGSFFYILGIVLIVFAALSMFKVDELSRQVALLFTLFAAGAAFAWCGQTFFKSPPRRRK